MRSCPAGSIFGRCRCEQSLAARNAPQLPEGRVEKVVNHHHRTSEELTDFDSFHYISKL